MAIVIRKRNKKLIDVKFVEWIKSFKNGETREVILLAFFTPGKFNSFTLSFTDGVYRIRKNFPVTNTDIVSELRRWYTIIRQEEGRAIFTVQKKNEEIIIDLKGIEKSNYVYAHDEKGNLVLKKISEKTAKEDIPF